jgi:uroporphyrinogen-III synthase
MISRKWSILDYQVRESFIDRHAHDTNYGKDLPWWIIYFAPSAAAFVTPHIRDYFILQPEQNDTNKRLARIAAIGPTTATFLSGDLHLQVDVTASKPNPTDLVQAIAEFDKIHA